MPESTTVVELILQTIFYCVFVCVYVLGTSKLINTRMVSLPEQLVLTANNVWGVDNMLGSDSMKLME